MISRRSFLIGAGGFLTLSLIERYLAFLENHGEPLIEAPRNPDQVLYVYPDREFDMGFNADPWGVEIPDITWEEYLIEIDGYDKPTTLSDFRKILRYEGLFPSELKQHVPEYVWMEHFAYSGPNGQAFDLLKKLNIGSTLEIEGEELGGLIFYDCDGPCSSYRGVQAEDDLSVSLLQHQLNELETGIAVRRVMD